MNSKAFPFLIIAGLVLMGAVVWNLTTNNDEIEKTSTEKPENKKIVEVEQKPKVEKVEDIVIENYDKPEVSLPMSAEEIKLRKEQSSIKMRFALQFQSAEKAIEGLKAMRANGDNKSASDMIEFINSTFPNATIPSELLD